MKVDPATAAINAFAYEEAPQNVQEWGRFAHTATTGINDAA